MFEKNILPETNASKKQHVQKHGEAKLVFASFWGHYDLLEFRFRRWVMADFFQRSMVFFLIFFYSGLGGGRRQKVGLYNKLPICCTESTSRSKRTSPPKKEKYNYTTCKYFNQKKTWSIWHTNTHQCVIFLSLHIHQGRGVFFFLPCGRSCTVFMRLLHHQLSAVRISFPPHPAVVLLSEAQGKFGWFGSFRGEFWLGSKVILLPIKGWDMNGF